MDSLAWCRERMLVPRQPLAASLLFAAPEQRDSILAVRTLAAELMALLDGPAEPALLGARLNWWRGALAGSAEHPALTAVATSCDADRVRPASFMELLEGVAKAGLNERFERFEELWQQCRELGGQIAAVEQRLAADSSSETEPALELGAAGWLLRRVRDIVRDARQNRWAIPLDLQAQFQVARQDVLEARGGAGWDGLVRTLLMRALKNGDAAADQLQPVQRHLKIHWAVEKRLAVAMAGRPQSILHRRVLPAHAGNVWAAWRAARRLGKAKG